MCGSHHFGGACLTFLAQLGDVYNLCRKLVAGCHFDALSDDAEGAPGVKAREGGWEPSHHVAPTSSHYIRAHW